MRKVANDINTLKEVQETRDSEASMKHNLMSEDKFMTEQDISNGQKWYNYNGKKVGSAYIKLCGAPKEIQLQKWYVALIEELQKTQGEMLIFIVFDMKNSVTFEYQIMKDTIKETVSQGILSIEKDIMPKIEARCLEKRTTKEKIEAIVKYLIMNRNKIATMESYTVGLLASEITNISGGLEVLQESYIACSNKSKIKFGVAEDIIKTYTVYSAEVATSMANAVKKNTNADITIGVTGQIGSVDPYNFGCKNNSAWYSISTPNKASVCKISILKELPHLDKKKIVIREIVETLYKMIY